MNRLIINSNQRDGVKRFINKIIECYYTSLNINK